MDKISVLQEFLEQNANIFSMLFTTEEHRMCFKLIKEILEHRKYYRKFSKYY